MIPAIQIFGVEEALYALTELPRRVRFKHLRIALNAGGGIVSRAAASRARRVTGLLAKSIGVKVVIPDASFNEAHHGKPAQAIIGPKRKSGRFMRVSAAGNLIGFGKAQKALQAKRKQLAGFGIHPLAREQIAVAMTKQAEQGAIYRNPSRYAHLVEKGTKRSRAFPFLAPAIAATRAQVVETIGRKLHEGFESESRVLVAQGRR